MRLIFLCANVDTNNFINSGYRTLQLAHSLAKEEVEIHFISNFGNALSISNNKVSKKIYYHNVSLYNWPDIDYISYVYKLNLSFIPVLFKTIKKYGPFDILCSFDWTVSIAAKAGASSYQLIWVNFLSSLESIRNDLENTDNNYIFTMEKFILKQKNTIITESNYLESELRKMCKKDKNIKYLFPYYTTSDINRYFPTEKRIIIIYSSFYKQNQIEIVLDLVSKLKPYERNYNILVVGEGILFHNIKNNILNSNAADFTVVKEKLSYGDLVSFSKNIDLFIAANPYYTNLSVISEILHLNIPVFINKTKSFNDLHKFLPKTHFFNGAEDPELLKKINVLLKKEPDTKGIMNEIYSVESYASKLIQIFRELRSN
jgi:hypothetical protein